MSPDVRERACTALCQHASTRDNYPCLFTELSVAVSAAAALGRFSNLTETLREDLVSVLL